MFRSFIAAFLLGTLVVPAASAQELNSAAERTAACLKIEDAAERLACFEAAAGELSDALQAESEAPPAPAPQASAGAPAQTSEQLPEWAEAPEPEAEPAPAPVQQAATATDSVEEERLPVWARVLPRRDKPDAEDSISVSVTRILRNASGRHFFITADGQEWEQTMAEEVRPPKSLPAQATIEEALLGNPRLTFDDGPSGAYKVRRTK